MTVAALVEHLDNFQHRVVQDALTEATATYWHRRAATFEWARPRPDDYAGRATTDDLAARDAALVELIEACHAKSAASVLGAIA